MILRPTPRAILLPMRVWDGATRLFHWAVVLLTIVLYVSISLADGPDTLLWMRIHVVAGETMLALLLFRLIWGFIGSDTARFARFLRSPFAAVHHLAGLLRREPDREIGHNPAGGWMAVTMILLLLVQVASGLCANDDGSTEGPLARYVGKELSDRLSTVHSVAFNVLIGAVILHVAAIVFYQVVKRQNLLRPMITGKKRLPAATRAPRIAHPALAAVLLVLTAAVAAVVARL